MKTVFIFVMPPAINSKFVTIAMLIIPRMKN